MRFIGFFLKVRVSTPLFLDFIHISASATLTQLQLLTVIHLLRGSWLDLDGFLVVVMTFELCGPSIVVYEVYLFIFVLWGCSADLYHREGPMDRKSITRRRASTLMALWASGAVCI